MKFFSSYVSPQASRYVSEVLKSTMLSEGEYVLAFEHSLEQHFHLPVNSVVTTNSGTSALHLALAVLGIGVGDEVILPAQTFVATGLAVLYAGAKPVFCDIGRDGNIDPDEILKKVTARTKAVVAVNWAGFPCDTFHIERIAKKYGLKFIIDAAQSLGSGMGGDITCLSFQATKHLTTGDGGAVICYNPQDAETARALRWFGIRKDADVPDVLGERVYDLKQVGFKYHMNNVSAAIGIANLETFDERWEHRMKIASIYWNEIRHRTVMHGWGAFWAFPIWVDNVKDFSLFCRERGIPVSVIHRGIDHNTLFGGTDYSLKNQRLWEKHVTHLPIHHDVLEEEAEWICSEINQYV